MRIGIDIRILEKKMCGIGRYTEGILQGISQLADDKNQYFLFCVNGTKEKWPQDIFKVIPTWKNIGIPRKIYSFSPFWLNFVLPWYLEKYDIEICFFPAHFCPWVKSQAKNVIAIHDMAHRLDKKAKNWWRKIYINFFLSQSVKKSSAVVTVSESSKKDILKIYPILKSEKVFVIYNAADRKFEVRDINELSKDRADDLQKKYNLPKDFVLYVGKIEERKNIKGILKIADLMHERNKKIKFLLVGNKGYMGYKELKEEIGKRRNKNVLRIDYIDDKDLPYIYNLAKVFLFPSFYEGFGLGVLEAMQSGVPVMTSNTSSMPEIVGEGGLMHEPYDYDNFLNGIIKLLEDKDFYNQMQKKGLSQARKFSWQISAGKLVKVFEGLT